MYISIFIHVYYCYQTINRIQNKKCLHNMCVYCMYVCIYIYIYINNIHYVFIKYSHVFTL